MKLFLQNHLFLLFILSTSIQAANYSCNGQDVANVNGATSDKSKTYTENNYEKSGEDQTNLSRYFQFKTDISGSIDISFNNTDGNQAMRIGTSCGSNNLYGSGNKSSASKTLSIAAGTTYYVQMQERNNDNTLKFTIKFDFKAKKEADLSITKTVNNNTANVGDNVTFTIVGKNESGNSKSKFKITDTLPNELAFDTTYSNDGVSENSNGFSCSTSGQTATCEGDHKFNTGNDVTVTIKAKVKSAGTIQNTATIQSKDGITDPDSTDNNATATLTATNPLPYGGPADGVCYEEPVTNGSKTTTPINSTDGTLQNVVVYFDTSSLISIFGSSPIDDCSVDSGNKGDNCEIQSSGKNNFGPVSMFNNGGVTFDLADVSANQNRSISTYKNSNGFFDFISNFFTKTGAVQATYVKNSHLYKGVLKACQGTTPPSPGDETIPTTNPQPEAPNCGTFADMFQTRGECSGSSAGSVEFTNAGQTIDGTKNIIIDNNDSQLNTCEVTVPPWVENQYETCGKSGDCEATGTAANSFNITYANAPSTTNVSASPSSSNDNITLDGTGTLSGYEYNNITTSWHTNTTTTFNITNQLKINSLKMTTGNDFSFTSSANYSLDIGTLGVKNNGAGNTITTDNNAKNIKISTFELPSSTVLTLNASQTIKMNNFTVGRNSSITLKAPYISINNFTSSNSGSGDSHITIQADYIDIGKLTLGQTVTLTIEPFTPGKRVLFRTNTLTESSSSSILLSSGNYYVNTTLTIPGTSDVSALRAVDENQNINLYINDDLTLGNNPGINATGNNGNYNSSFPASKFIMFVNGDLTTGGGGTTINATIYLEGKAQFGNPTYIKGAISAEKITVGQGQFTYDQSLDDAGFGECNTNTTYGCSKPHAFELRKNLVISGDLIAIGNSNICADDDKNGICDTNQKKRNDTSNIIEVNSTSSSAVAGEPSSLHNTSAANLSLPAGASVVWAGLYWQGEIWDINMDHTSRVGGSGIAIENGEDGQARKALADTIKFKVPGSSYVELTADEHYYFFVQRGSNKNSDYKDVNNRYEEHYQSFKNVTDLVANAGEGDYWVANIQATVGKLWYPGVESAWSLQVIYNDPNGEPRSISITDGYLGLYSNGNSGDKYANTINSINGNNKCLTGGSNTGAYSNKVSFDVGGFLTPSDAGFQTDMSLFITESDPDGNRPEEKLTITKKDGSISAIDGPDAWNYEITLKDGVTNNDARTPNYIYPIGMTIKNYHQTDILSPEQISTTVTFETGSDRLMLGIIGFATDLRKPKLCYDYSYSQYDTFLTEDNNGSQAPKITATVDTSAPLDVQLYIQNIENSDIIASGMQMSVFDINTSQATYISGTTKISAPGSTIVNSVSESNINSSTAYIKNIQLGDLDSLQYFYTYYQLDSSKVDMNMPIYARVDYNITLPLADSGDTITIPYQVYLNSDIPLCSNNDYSYQPTYGVFNIVHNDYYNSLTQYYNLPTQVTSREGNFKVIALDATNQDQLKGLSTVVAVELIAAEGFHITDAQCQDPSKSISDRVWVTFDGNTSFAMFNKAAIQNSIARGMTSLTSSSDFYKNARENAAFRVSYNLTNDGNDSLVKTELQNNGNYKILNFTQLVQNISNCSSPVENPSNPSHTTNNVSVACGNAGNNGISARQLRICNECVYGYNTKFVCSRDNFSIRPEALSVKVYDDNQSTQPKLEIDNTISDVVTPSSNSLNLAAGYDYDVEVNATNYLNHNASPGYTKTIDPSSTDTAMYKWEPRNSHIITGCNETNNSNLNLTFFNGTASSRKTLSQVGEYRLHVEDDTWTSVDSNPTYMAHHTGTYFASGSDCIQNSNITEVTDVSAGSSRPLIGCNISSTHDNSFNAPTNNLKYRDYNITFHPYTFDVSNIVHSVGLDNAPITGTSYVYMADLAQPQDENMSYHLNGIISAVGKNNVALSNFVNNCYAEPLNITLNKSTTTLPVAYQYRFHTYEANSTEIGVSNVVDFNNSNSPIIINTQSFPKDLNGSVDTRFNLNYDRTNDNAMNPEAITFIDYNVTCSTQANCAYSANKLNNKTPQGVLSLNNTVKYYYGRTHAPRQKFTTPVGTSDTNPAKAFIYYEIYCSGTTCDKTLLPNASNLTTTDDPRWFINTQHTVAEGTALNVVQKSASVVTTKTNPSGNAPDFTEIYYEGSKGYPYKTTMENNASGWLIYNKYNPSATTNEFQVEFINGGANWSGAHETNTTSVNGGTSITNRRVMW